MCRILEFLPILNIKNSSLYLTLLFIVESSIINSESESWLFIVCLYYYYMLKLFIMFNTVYSIWYCSKYLTLASILHLSVSGIISLRFTRALVAELIRCVAYDSKNTFEPRRRYKTNLRWLLSNVFIKFGSKEFNISELIWYSVHYSIVTNDKLRCWLQ